MCNRELMKGLGLQMVGKAVLLPRSIVTLNPQAEAGVLGERFSLGFSPSDGSCARALTTSYVFCLDFFGVTLGGFG